MTEICLRFDNPILGYSGHAAVHHLSGEVSKGSLIAIVGANVSGKSDLDEGRCMSPQTHERGISREVSAYRLSAQLSELNDLLTSPEMHATAAIVDEFGLVSSLWPGQVRLGRHTADAACEELCFGGLLR